MQAVWSEAIRMKIVVAEKVAANAVQLLKDETLHYRMAKTGRWSAAERFCTEKIIPLYERHYEEVVNG